MTRETMPPEIANLCWAVIRKRTNTMGYWGYIKTYCKNNSHGQEFCYRHKGK